MDFEIKMDEGKKIAIITLHRVMTKELARQVLQCIKKLTEDHGIERLLSDVRYFPIDISPFDQYYFIYNLPKQSGNHPDRKIAIWAGKEDHSYDFAETCFLNSGQYARKFLDYDEALRWLTA